MRAAVVRFVLWCLATVACSVAMAVVGSLVLSRVVAACQR